MSDFDNVEDYRENFERASDEGSSRYAAYTAGKAEAASLVEDGDVDSITQLNERARERMYDADVNTHEAAVAKGMVDAVEELASIADLPESGVDDADEDEDDDEGEASSDDEEPSEVADDRGVTVDVSDIDTN